MAGQHHQCNEHELGQTPGDGEGQGSLACYSPWDYKDSDSDSCWEAEQQQHLTFLMWKFCFHKMF